MTRRYRLTLGMSLFLVGGQVFAQKPTFEVASVKLNTSESGNGSVAPRGDRFLATNVTLEVLVRFAYVAPERRSLYRTIFGLPKWGDVDHFDVEAKAGGDQPISGDRTRIMLQSLLEDRFQLRIHNETRRAPVYSLVLTTKGPKVSPDQSPLKPGQEILQVSSRSDELASLPRGALRMVITPTKTTLTGTAISVPRILSAIAGAADRVIVDETSLQKLIDVQLEFSDQLAPEQPDGVRSVGSSLFAALEEIGLKLTPSTAPMDVLVIDSVQRPTGN